MKKLLVAIFAIAIAGSAFARPQGLHHPHRPPERMERYHHPHRFNRHRPPPKPPKHHHRRDYHKNRHSNRTLNIYF